MMKQFIDKIMACDDMQAVKNCVLIMSEAFCAEEQTPRMLELIKEIQSEVDECHYDEDMADMHLRLIGQYGTIQTADARWKIENGIQRYDWRVLWGEMSRRNMDKIVSWFGVMDKSDIDDKIYDECVSFIEHGGNVYHELNV